MTKRELIDEIRGLNPTAGAGFLSGFEESDLQEYLDHLRWTGSSPAASGPRPADEPAPLQAPPARPAARVFEPDTPEAMEEPEPAGVAVSTRESYLPFAHEDREEQAEAWML